MALTDHRDKAVVNQDGFYIAPGTETLTALVPSVLNTTERALNHFTPQDRDCYMDSEFEFRYLRRTYGFRYDMNNCLYEAVMERIVKNCSCVPHFANFKVGIRLSSGVISFEYARLRSMYVFCTRRGHATVNYVHTGIRLRS